MNLPILSPYLYLPPRMRGDIRDVGLGDGPDETDGTCTTVELPTLVIHDLERLVTTNLKILDVVATFADEYPWM